MCRKGAWAELTVEVTSVDAVRSAARIKKEYTASRGNSGRFLFTVIPINPIGLLKIYPVIRNYFNECLYRTSGPSQSYLNLKHHLDFYAALGSVAVARYGAFTRLACEANLGTLS